MPIQFGVEGLFRSTSCPSDSMPIILFTPFSVFRGMGTRCGEQNSYSEWHWPRHTLYPYIKAE